MSSLPFIIASEDSLQATMKLLNNLLTAIAVSAVSAREAAVYYFPQDASLQGDASITPKVTPATARWLFANRLHLSQYYDLSGADASSLEKLSAIRGGKTYLFGKDAGDRVLLIVESIQDAQGK